MSNKLKVAVWYNLPSGGAKRALFDQLQGLQARGHQFEAWRPQIPQADFSAISSLMKEHEIPIKILPEGGFYMDRIVRHVLRTRILLKSMKEHAQKCAVEIDQGGFDLLFANTDMYYAMPFVGRYSGLPKTVYLQEPKRHFYEALPDFLWKALPEEIAKGWSPHCLIKRIRDRFDIHQFRIEAREEFENARSYDRILVNSYYSRESVLRAYGLNAEVCYLSIDLKRFRNLGLERERFVVGLGTASHTKNVALAIRAVGAMAEPRPTLVWIANMVDEVYVKTIKALAESLSVKFDLRFHVGDDEVLDTLNRASMMLYTSRLEPFGLAPLEANACGLPVVGVREGGVRETILDGVNGILCAESPEEIAGALTSLLDDPGNARSMGLRGAEIVAKSWSLEAGLDRIEEALLRTAGRI